MASILNYLFLAPTLLVVAFATLVPFLLQKSFKVYDPSNSPASAELIVLVTGSSSGIGLDAAVALAEKGYHVYGTVRKEKDAEKLMSLKIKNPKGKLTAVMMDVTDNTSIKRVFEEIKAKMERNNAVFVALVNNAGLAEVGFAEAIEDGLIRKLFDVNVFGVIQVTRTFLPLLRQSKGRVVNVGSISGVVSFPLVGAYSASKFALEGYTDALRIELLEHGVAVSLIQPGPVESDMSVQLDNTQDAIDGVPQELKADKVYAKLLNKYIAGRKFASESKMALPPNATTTPVIISAVMDKYPKTRYAVSTFAGVPIWFMSLFVAYMPDRLKDALILSA